MKQSKMNRIFAVEAKFWPSIFKTYTSTESRQCSQLEAGQSSNDLSDK